MRSRLSRVLAGVMTSALAVGVVASLAADADAQRRGRRGRRQAQQPQRAPMSDAIGPALQGIEWGWSPDKLMEHHRRKIRSEFQPRINKARDAMTEDRLRHQRDQILRRMRESFIEFNGQTTGYDSDIAAFKAVVPDALDCKAWFAAKGAWGNGQKFGEESSSWF